MFSRSVILCVFGLLAVFTAPAGPANAALGRSYSSVETDRSILGATIASTSAGPYTMHTLTLPNQGVVKEFTRADGRVFALLWRSPGRPDLRQLLGDNFAVMQSDNTVHADRRLRRPIGVRRSDILIQTGGHAGAFWGAAILPLLEPAGFSASDLKLAGP